MQSGMGRKLLVMDCCTTLLDLEASVVVDDIVVLSMLFFSRLKMMFERSPPLTSCNIFNTSMARLIIDVLNPLWTSSFTNSVTSTEASSTEKYSVMSSPACLHGNLFLMNSWNISLVLREAGARSSMDVN